MSGQDFDDFKAFYWMHRSLQQMDAYRQAPDSIPDYVLARLAGLWVDTTRKSIEDAFGDATGTAGARRVWLRRLDEMDRFLIGCLLGRTIR